MMQQQINSDSLGLVAHRLSTRLHTPLCACPPTAKLQEGGFQILKSHGSILLDRSPGPVLLSFSLVL